MFHKEGFAIIRNTLTGLIAINATAWYFAGGFNWAVNLLIFASAVFATVVVENETTGPILFRQVAGAVARRIVMYSKKGDKATQGADMGFIKFGSRIDIFLPLDAKINANIDDVVKGGETVIATC